MPATPATAASTRLAPAWSAPLAARLSRLIADLSAAGSPAALESAWTAALRDVPDLMSVINVEALAFHMEASMGMWAVAGLAGSALSRTMTRTSTLSADPSAEAVAFAPFTEAAERIASRRPVASVARTAAWADVPSMLRSRAFFSAGVESANWLDRTHSLLAKRLRLEKEQLQNGRSAWTHRDTFIDSARRIAAEAGLPMADAGKVGTLQDIRSLPRLSLIYDVQNQQAAEYARRKADLDPTAMDLYPGFALVREESRMVPRGESFWNDRWRQAGGAVGWKDASRNGRAALKTSPIWQALGSLGPFGVPYPPFAWGSGMGQRDLSRAECETAGLLRPGQPAPAGSAPQGLVDDLHASVRVSPEIQQRLQKLFGNQVKIADGTAKWRG